MGATGMGHHATRPARDGRGVHGDLIWQVCMTVDRVALIDWDESHVDVTDLDLVLPHKVASLADVAYDMAAQAPAAERRAAGTTSTPSSGWPNRG